MADDSIEVVSDPLIAIHNAIANDDIDELKKLIDNTENITGLLNNTRLESSYFGTALHSAVRPWHTIKCQCTCRLQIYDECFCKPDNDHCLEFHRSGQNYQEGWLYQHRADIVMLLLENGCDPDIKDFYKRTALDWANDLLDGLGVATLISSYMQNGSRVSNVEPTSVPPSPISESPTPDSPISDREDNAPSSVNDGSSNDIFRVIDDSESDDEYSGSARPSSDDEQPDLENNMFDLDNIPSDP